MKVYHLERKQFFPVSIDKAWSYFSTPSNLGNITPGDMYFKTLYQSGGDKAYSGQIIQYKIRILPGVVFQWVTEITHLHEPEYFVDEQRFGPYALWHHQHHFKTVAGGVEMTDIVNYAIPLGLFGRLAHWLFVGKKVNEIFDFRSRVLEKHWAK